MTGFTLLKCGPLYADVRRRCGPYADHCLHVLPPRRAPALYAKIQRPEALASRRRGRRADYRALRTVSIFRAALRRHPAVIRRRAPTIASSSWSLCTTPALAAGVPSLPGHRQRRS